MTQHPVPFPPVPPVPPATRLTARTPEDLLAAAAVVLGFWPSESVVMLTFDATHSFHARADLPDGRDACRDLAETLVAPALQHDVGRVVLLLYTAHPARAETAWRALRAAFRRHGVEIIEAVHVDADHWYRLAGDGPARTGVRFDPSRLAHHRFLAQAVADGRVLRASREELAATLDPDEHGRARVVALLPGDGPATSAPDPLAEGTWAFATVARHVDAVTTASDADAARLLVAMLDLRVRDAAWSALSRDRSRAAVAFLADLVRRSPPHLLPAPAALLAWAAWQSGDGALAWCAVDRCDAVDPDYRLSGLVADALVRAVPPTVWRDDVDWRAGLAAGPGG